MTRNEDFYKREQDQKWREKVDHEQVTLMTAVNVIQESLRDIKRRLANVEVALHGERGTGGLIAEYERHDEKLTKLYAVVFQDPTGQKGLLHDIDVLMGRKKDDDQSSGYRWAFWTAVVTAVISSGSLFLMKGHVIEKFLERHSTDKVSLMIEKAKHPKPKRRRIEPPPPVNQEESE